MNKRCMIILLIGISLLLSGCAKQQQLSIADRTTRGETNTTPQDAVNQEETIGTQETDEQGTNQIQEIEVAQKEEEKQESEKTQEPEEIQETQETQETGTTLESADPTSGDGITYITEKLFITQINHIYYNAQDYLGKPIEYEGIFETYRFEDTDQTYYYVVRYGPGCCSNDSSAGFEIVWDADIITKPEENAWVKVRGVLHEYEEGEYTYLRLDVVSLEEMETRGQEYVEN